MKKRNDLYNQSEKDYKEGWTHCYETYSPELISLRQENEALRGLLDANIRVAKSLETKDETYNI